MPITIWIVFLSFVFVLLFLDLKVFHRHAHAVSLREAGLLSLFWIALSLGFNFLVYFLYEYHWMGFGTEIGNPMGGAEAATKFFTAYIIEKSLSVDNLFVIALIFTYFKIDGEQQHRVLFWGILGALVFRGVMIAAGAALMRSFEWTTYLFGAILLYSAFKMLRSKEEEVDPNKNPVVKVFRRVFPVSMEPHPKTFIVRENGKRMATMLLVALLVIESTDIMFAVDSIPAVFSITTDTFIAFTSNIFALLGLRSLFFLLAAFLDRFQYLKTSLVFVLAFVGIKMLLAQVYHIPTGLSLGIILGILAAGLLSSVFLPKGQKGEGEK